MKRIVIMNAKGGCGKTTVATNLASYFAKQGVDTALFDHDPQGSSSHWLSLRPKSFPEIYGVTAFQTSNTGMTRSWQLRVPNGVKRVIVDTEAGVSGHKLLEHTKDADIILIPVIPSPIDINATAGFIRELLLVAKVRCNRTRIGIVTNRVKANTLAFASLKKFLNSLQIPVICQLRDTQNYVYAAEIGIGVHDIDLCKVAQDKQSWGEIASWIQNNSVRAIA